MIRVYNTLLDDLEKASNYDRQKYEWLDNEEGIVSSFTEDYYSGTSINPFSLRTRIVIVP